MKLRDNNPLYNLRKQHYLSLRETANALEIAPMSVSYIERGNYNMLSIAMAKKIAAYFNVSPYELIKQYAMWLDNVENSEPCRTEEEKENAPQLSAKERI